MGILNNVYKKRVNLQQERKKEALKNAEHIARILGEQFGAKEVILYGSLVKETYFDIASDIDLAVKGLGDKYLMAYGRCLRLSKFDLDIKPYEDMPEEHMNRVDTEGKCLYAKRAE